MKAKVLAPLPKLLLLVLCTLGLPFAANASVIFDWGANTWTAGTPAAGETLTQSFTSVSPNDITVAINNSGTGVLGGMNFQPNYPQISAAPLTNGLTGTNALQLYVANSQAVGTSIRTTVTFATPVINLSFAIWDVDAAPGQFIDKIANIQALAQGGGTVGPDSVTHPAPGFNTITGTGLATVVLGTANANNSTNQGEIDITFNGPITQFSFEWSNNDPALGAQAIALGALTYTPVPEAASAGSVAAVCAIIVALECFRSLRRRRAARFPSR